MKANLNSLGNVEGLEFETALEVSEMESAFHHQLEFYETYCNLDPVDYPATYKAYLTIKRMCESIGIR